MKRYSHKVAMNGASFQVIGEHRYTEDDGFIGMQGVEANAAIVIDTGLARVHLAFSRYEFSKLKAAILGLEENYRRRDAEKGE